MHLFSRNLRIFSVDCLSYQLKWNLCLLLTRKHRPSAHNLMSSKWSLVRKSFIPSIKRVGWLTNSKSSGCTSSWSSEVLTRTREVTADLTSIVLTCSLLGHTLTLVSYLGAAPFPWNCNFWWLAQCGKWGIFLALWFTWFQSWSVDSLQSFDTSKSSCELIKKYKMVFT